MALEDRIKRCRGGQAVVVVKTNLGGVVNFDNSGNFGVHRPAQPILSTVSPPP